MAAVFIYGIVSGGGFLFDIAGGTKTEHYFAANYEEATKMIKKCKTMDRMYEKEKDECNNAQSVIEKADFMVEKVNSDFKGALNSLKAYYSANGKFSLNLDDMIQNNSITEPFGIKCLSFIAKNANKVVAKINTKADICKFAFLGGEFDQKTYEISNSLNTKKGSIVIEKK